MNLWRDRVPLTLVGSSPWLPYECVDILLGFPQANFSNRTLRANRSAIASGIDCFAALLAKKYRFLVICTVKWDFSIVNESDRSILTSGHWIVCVTPIRLLGGFFL